MRAPPTAAGHRRGGSVPDAVVPTVRRAGRGERDSSSSSTRARRSDWSRAFSSAIPAAAATASSSSGWSRSAGSCSSTATGAPSRSTSVTARRASRPGSSARRPSRSAYSSKSGSQYASSSDGSRSARASAERRLLGAGLVLSSSNRSPTDAWRKRACSTPTRNAIGASPNATKVARRIISNVSPPSTSPNAPARKRKANITRTRENESITSARDRPSLRPVVRRRVRRIANEISAMAASTTSCRWSRSVAASGSPNASSSLSSPKPPSRRPTICSANAVT